MFNNFTLDSYLSKIRFLVFCFACMLALCLLFNPSTFAQVDVSITIEPSSPVVKSNETVDISGIITLTPDDETTQNDFLNENLKLIRINPDGEYDDIIVTQPFLYEQQLQYKFEGVKLPDKGVWKLLVGSEKSETFKKANSATIEIEAQRSVQAVAGYAILIEGRVSGDVGIDSHNLTTNYIYKKLLNRGFEEDDIYYFNFNETQNGVDEKPTEEGVLNAIKVWASEKMNESPAPLYIIYVGHGKKETLFIYPDTVNAGELSDALNDLEFQLNTNAAEESIVVVLGANRSGSFINALSKAGTKRIIITSSDTEEVAYKGPLAPDETIRHGDYFVYEFFKYAEKGRSLKKGYEVAAGKIATFTENENGNGLDDDSAGNGQYFDKTAQHPLLDDNGDGIGTFKSLSSTNGEDGALSSDLVIGMGTSTSLLELTGVTDVVSLESGTSTPELFAKVNDITKVDTAWVEIVSPNTSLKNDADTTEQQIINLPRFSYSDFDEAEEKYIWNNFSGNDNFDNFVKAGRYEIFYFARDIDTGEITSLMESEVYKNKEGNIPPTSPDVISPTDGIEIAVAWTFDWEDSTDTDSNTAAYGKNKNAESLSEDVTYTFTISQSSTFDSIYYRQKGLTDSITTVDKTAKLYDGEIYYWRVLASDADGGVTVGNAGSFLPKFTNYPGFVKGFIFDGNSNEKVSGATISVRGTKDSYSTTKSGTYLLQLLSGTYTVSVDALGYETKTRKVFIKALDATTQNIGLETSNTQLASISGKVKDKKTKELLEEATITVEKNTFSKTTTSDSNGNYSITGLKSGRYKLTTEKSGYKSYKKTIKLKAGQNKKIHIKLSKTK